MCVVTNAISGAQTMTLAASSLTLKALSIARIREKPSNAAAEDISSFSVSSTSLHCIEKLKQSENNQHQI